MKKKILLWASVFLIIGSILILSSENSVDSTTKSINLIVFFSGGKLGGIGDREKPAQSDTSSTAMSEIPSSTSKNTSEKIEEINLTTPRKTILTEHSFRKLMHVAEYFVLCLILCLLFKAYKIKRWYLFAILHSIAFIILDESFQGFFVDGRNMQVTDMLNDLTGCLIAVIMVLIVSTIVKSHKKINKKAATIITSVILFCAALYLLDVVFAPAYIIKSTVKVLLIASLFVFYMVFNKDFFLKKIFLIINKKHILFALLAAFCVFAVIIGGFFLFKNHIDFTSISKSIIAKEGLNKGTFFIAAIYIGLVNSLAEELFFRGFAYIKLSEYTNKKFAFIFSASAFALYHVSIIEAWFSIPMFMLLFISLFVAGGIFNFFDRKGSILPSWIIHISANLCINGIAMFMFDYV